MSEVLMKVVNPREGKCPTLEVDEPFMLWCPRRKMYATTVITRWYRSSYGYVIRDTQGARDTSIVVFCVAGGDGRDLFDRVYDARQALMQSTYTIYYM